MRLRGLPSTSVTQTRMQTRAGLAELIAIKVKDSTI